MEQTCPRGSLVIPSKPPGQAESHIGYEQGMFIAGDGKVMAPAFHLIDLPALQQRGDTVQKGGIVQFMLRHAGTPFPFEMLRRPKGNRYIHYTTGIIADEMGAVSRLL